MTEKLLVIQHQDYIQCAPMPLVFQYYLLRSIAGISK